MMYDISLDNFQGPMDLLLHLIKKKKMNIMDIKLEIIIDEYLDYIKKQEQLNLNIASSYLVMASELIEIKSRMLLPSSQEDEEEDLKENLIIRLIEYEKYKEMIPTFKDLELERNNYKTKSPTSILEYKTVEKIESDLTIDDLVNVYKKFLERLEDEKPINTKVTKRELSVDSQIKRIRDIFKINKKINFLDLFEKKSKDYIIVTFLAILEMSSKKEIKIVQENNFAEITCEVVE
ncbi:MAG: segregation/condensation protein A [Bacilli bacterium]|nr:segregation/condensation protein A [Bacilli bacterium]